MNSAFVKANGDIVVTPNAKLRTRWGRGGGGGGGKGGGAGKGGWGGEGGLSRQARSCARGGGGRVFSYVCLPRACTRALACVCMHTYVCVCPRARAPRRPPTPPPAPAPPAPPPPTRSAVTNLTRSRPRCDAVSFLIDVPHDPAALKAGVLAAVKARRGGRGGEVVGGGKRCALAGRRLEGRGPLSRARQSARAPAPAAPAAPTPDTSPPPPPARQAHCAKGPAAGEFATGAPPTATWRDVEAPFKLRLTVAYNLAFTGESVGRAFEARDGLITAVLHALSEGGATYTNPMGRDALRAKVD